MSGENMTKEQIKNWRRILTGMIGCYALIMPESDIIAFRDKLQNNINKEQIQKLKVNPEREEKTFGEKLSINLPNNS